MTDSLIRAWIACADEDFGGSLDYEPDVARKPQTGAVPQSGVSYVYRMRDRWQVRIPGVPTRVFQDIDAARDYVRLHVEAI